MRLFAYRILDFISTIACFMVAFSLLFIVQYWTIGLIPPLNKIIIFNKIYLKEVLFTITSLFVVINFVKVQTPYRKYLSK